MPFERLPYPSPFWQQSSTDGRSGDQDGRVICLQGSYTKIFIGSDRTAPRHAHTAGGEDRTAARLARTAGHEDRTADRLARTVSHEDRTAPRLARTADDLSLIHISEPTRPY